MRRVYVSILVFPYADKMEETKVAEQQLTPTQKSLARSTALGVTDGKNPFREVNQYCMECLITNSKRISGIEEKSIYEESHQLQPHC